jgi:hypothetical protein
MVLGMFDPVLAVVKLKFQHGKYSFTVSLLPARKCRRFETFFKFFVEGVVSLESRFQMSFKTN